MTVEVIMKIRCLGLVGLAAVLLSMSASAGSISPPEDRDSEFQPQPHQPVLRSSAADVSFGGEMRWCWRDAKSGQRLSIYPISSDPDRMRPGHRVRPAMTARDGQIIQAADFVEAPDGWWIDALTGRTAISVPEASWPLKDPSRRLLVKGVAGGREAVVGLAERVQCATYAGASLAGASLERESAEVLAEINRVRADPAAYAEELSIGSSAPVVREAVDFLRHQAPMPPLDVNSNLQQSAIRHVIDQGRTGSRSHLGTDGSTVRQRVYAAGLRASLIGEEIAFDADTAAGVVRQLVIDEGIPDRGHRAVMFHDGLASAGAACGPHAAYRMICVIDIAGPTLVDHTLNGGLVVATAGTEN